MPATGEGLEGAVIKPTTQVCQHCKIRHRKCDFQEDGCQQCKDAGITCVRQSSLKFRYHPMQKALSRASARLWRPCPIPQGPAQFYDEGPELRASYHTDEELPPPQPGGQLSSSISPAHSSQSISTNHVSRSNLKDGHDVSEFPEGSVSLDYSMDDTSPLSEPFIAQPSPLDEHTSDNCPPLSPTEALLIRNFTDRMAQWTDIADPFRTFESVVSKLALTDLIIRNAVCAFSARHYYRDQIEDGNAIALDYQTRCLQLLIPAMSGGQKITKSILTAVALLRQNEEMDEQDNRFHLEGTSRILNMVPEFATIGGVGEAACWLCLREDIYISLTTQTPIKTPLDSFPDCVSIRRNDDYSWASKSILNLAFLLKRAFCEPRDSSFLALSEAEIADWDKCKPTSYQPIHVQPRSRLEGRCFPEVWMLLPYHAVGLQYYHIAQIVLNAVRPREVVHTHAYLAESRATARRIRHHLFMVLGIATSNERAQNTWFTARHCLAVWGAYLQHPADQAAALDFLEKWRQFSGWETSVLVRFLQQQWRENIEDD